MIYIDFDGVILDTDKVLFKEFIDNPNFEPFNEPEMVEYIKKSNWDYVIRNSEVINDSLYYLKESDPKETCILTKVHSIGNEGKAKIEWKNRNNLKQAIILVPFYAKKTDVVDAEGNELYDDCFKNLKEWKEKGGIPIFFDGKQTGYDNWGEKDTYNYQKVINLRNICKK